MHSRQRRIRLSTAILLALVVASSNARPGPASLRYKVPTVPLIQAVKRGDVAAAERLLVRGADPDARELVLTQPTLRNHAEWGKPVPADTALILAVKKEHIPLVTLLLAHGANVNGTGPRGDTPLIVAGREPGPRLRRVDVATLLLKAGARPNQTDDYRNTALDYAINMRDAKLVELLVKNGADPNLGWGQPPLEAALDQPDGKIAAIIRSAGGKSRSEEERRREHEEWARRVAEDDKRREAERQAEAQRGERDRELTPEDRQVVETVVLDPLRNQKDAHVILVNQTTEVRGLGLALGITYDLISAVPDGKEAYDVLSAIDEHLRQRNAQPISLAEFKPSSPHIRVGEKFWFERSPASAQAWVQVCLPGYSKSHDHAVVSFLFGPSSHGAHGACFLVKQHGVWRVKWRELFFGF